MILSPVMGFDKKMPWLKLRQPNSFLLNIKTTDIITKNVVKGKFILKGGKTQLSVWITWQSLSRTLGLGLEGTGDGKTLDWGRRDWGWKNPGLQSGKKEYSILTNSGSNSPLAAFAMSNESQLRSLIRSSKEAEIKIKGKGSMRHACLWGKVKNKLCDTKRIFSCLFLNVPYFK